MSNNTNGMKVTQTRVSDGAVVIFRWNDELSECEFTTGGIEFDEVDDLLDRMMLTGADEGNDYVGFTTEIKM